MTRAAFRALAAAATLVVLALSACGTSTQTPSVPPLLVDSSSTPITTAAPPARPAATDTMPRLSIAKIAASSTLVPLGLNPDKTVEVPPLSQPQQAGVYANGPVPGDPGPAVILGHVSGEGRPGIFARLSDLAAGDKIDVRRPDGRTATFRVYRTETVEKDVFPTSKVYSDTPNSELRLITCGGNLNPAVHSYLSNVIVFAALASIH